MNLPMLLLLGGAIVATTYLLVFSWNADGNWSRSIVKTISVTMLVLVGGAATAPWLALTGLALGATGDFCLSRPGKRAFLVGMAAFALGHLAYTALFLSWADPGFLAGSPMRLLLALGLALITTATQSWLTPKAGELRGPVRGYVLVIATMGFAALAVPQPGPTIGASLFLLSDLFLALRLFVYPSGLPRRFLAVLLWPAYWLGQGFILLAALTLMNSA